MYIVIRDTQRINILISSISSMSLPNFRIADSRVRRNSTLTPMTTLVKKGHRRKKTKIKLKKGFSFIN